MGYATVQGIAEYVGPSALSPVRGLQERTVQDAGRPKLGKAPQADLYNEEFSFQVLAGDQSAATPTWRPSSSISKGLDDPVKNLRAQFAVVLQLEMVRPDCRSTRTAQRSKAQPMPAALGLDAQAALSSPDAMPSLRDDAVIEERVPQLKDIPAPLSSQASLSCSKSVGALQSPPQLQEAAKREFSTAANTPACFCTPSKLHYSLCSLAVCKNECLCTALLCWIASGLCIPNFTERQRSFAAESEQRYSSSEGFADKVYKTEMPETFEPQGKPGCGHLGLLTFRMQFELLWQPICTLGDCNGLQ